MFRYVCLCVTETYPIISDSMGFISTGRGYKRRKSDPIYSFQRKVSPRNRLPFLNDLLPSPSTTPTSDSITSDIHEPPTLETLPVDILLLIYNYVGVGEANNMSFINKHFHMVIPLVKEKWWLEKMVRCHYVVDLNIDVSEKWEARYRSRYTKLPSSVRESWSGSDFLTLPSALGQYRHCIDSAVLKFKFIDHQTVTEMGKYLGHFALNRGTIEREQMLRNRYLNWRYMVLCRIVDTYQGSEEDLNIEEVQAQSEEAEGPKNYREKYSLSKYTPVTQSDPIPVSMFEMLSPHKIDAIMVLNKLFGMEIPRAGQLLSGIVRLCKHEQALSHLNHLAGLITKYNYLDVVTLLQALLHCRNLVLKSPLHDRGSSPQAQLLEELYHYMEEAFTLYYGQGQVDDEIIWDLLKQLEMPELIDHVVSLGGHPQ